MKKLLLLVPISVLLALTWSCQPKAEYKVGNVYHGFKLEQKKFVKEVNADCLYFTHEKSGARLLKIMADDENKLFNISFKTVPMTDYGTPHIFEHAVLQGSKNFPVKSPFDILSKGSLNTFLNAMTSSDWTTYPVASMNNKDYFNLMHVYLDAVFNPLLHENDKIFKQEGWHYELDNIDGEITYKGVVYNEMQGAFSSPYRELNYLVKKTLFPDNTYGVESGGYPSEIPNLKIEDFRAFHKKYYHPENSYVLLYGNADLDKELSFINENYFSEYEKTGEKVVIPLQKGFDQRKEVEGTYPIAENASTKDKTYFTYSFVFGTTDDQESNLALNILSQALVGHESAPLRLAIQEAGIGKDIFAYDNSNQQHVFTIGVEGANPEDKEAFKEIVFNTLEKVSKEGFDKDMLSGIINRMEFNLREGNTSQKGMMYLYSTIPTVFFSGNPFDGLEFEAPFANVKTNIETGLLQKIIKENLIDNTFCLLTTFAPEPGLENKRVEATRKKLADYKAGLSKEELQQLVNETKALKEYQETENTPEQIAMIPMLQLSDIEKEAKFYEVEEKTVDNNKVLFYNDFTNDILYTNLYFDLRVLPQELIPYAELLAEVMGAMNTEKYSFGELENALNINTGSFYTRTSSYLVKHSNDNFIPKFIVSCKATEEKENVAMEIVSEIINKTNYNDVERLKNLMLRHYSNTEYFINNKGINVALTRLSSYQTPYGQFRENTSGYNYYLFINDLMKNFDTKQDEIIENLNKTAKLLFNKDNMIASVSCSDKNYGTYEAALKNVIASLPNEKVEMQTWSFNPEVKNEGLMTSSKVQYVTKGANFKKLGYEWNPKMRVLNQILSREYLQTQIRVLGGAYGGFAGFGQSGTVYFASYRDPNLRESLENYDATPDFIENFDVDEQELTRYIIGTISNIEGPTTASQRGSMAVANYFEQATKEEAQAERDAILSTSVEDIKSFKKLVEDVLNQNIICVYGNEEKIKENNDLFKTTVALTE